MSEFWDVVFGQQKGYICVEYFKNKQPVKRGFLKWPDSRAKLEALSDRATEYDVYFRPVLFHQPRVARDTLADSLVTWADVDGNAATLPAASLAVASGTPGHVHTYWRSDEPLGASELEAWNYKHVKAVGADTSGWDATQLLRVPGTLNHKTDPPNPVELLYANDSTFPKPADLGQFRAPQYKRPDILPQLDTVLSKYDLSDKVQALLGAETDDRSKSMYHLACLLSNEGLPPDDAYVIVEHLDRRLGKYVGRHDRDTRLSQLVARAYETKLTLVETKPKSGLSVVGWQSVGRNKPAKVFLIDEILSPNGMILLGGHSGVGKSQLAITMCAKLVMGADKWCGFKVDVKDRPQTILYLSLEMDETDIQLVLSKMSSILPNEQLAQLDEHLLFHATLDYFKLDVENSPARKSIESAIKAHGLTGLVVDTLGAASSLGLQNEVSVRGTMSWLKHLRSKFGIWVMLLNHPRKVTNGQKRAELTMDDLYGVQAQQADLDAAFALTELDKSNGVLRLDNLKRRFGRKESGVNIRRTDSLWLEVTTVAINNAVSKKGDDFIVVDDSFEDDNEWG